MTNKPAMKNPIIRKPKGDSDTISARRVAWQLNKLPDQLRAAELRRDTARADFEKYLTGLSVEALTLAIFPGKSEGDPKQAASNETQRKLAIDHLCSEEEDFKIVREEYESAQRDLDTLRARQENLRLIARLMISQ